MNNPDKRSNKQQGKSAGTQNPGTCTVKDNGAQPEPGPVPVDHGAARQAIIAIEDIVRTNRPTRGFGPDEERLIERGRTALRFAARTADDDKWSMPETARQALESIARQLREARRWR